MATDLNTLTATFTGTNMKPEPDEELTSDWGSNIANNTAALVWQHRCLFDSSPSPWFMVTGAEDVEYAYFLYNKPPCTTYGTFRPHFRYYNETSTGTTSLTIWIDGTYMGSIGNLKAPDNTNVYSNGTLLIGGNMSGFTSRGCYSGTLMGSVHNGDSNSSITLFQLWIEEY